MSVRTLWKNFTRARPKYDACGPYFVTLVRSDILEPIAAWETDELETAVDVFQRHCLPPSKGYTASIADSERALLMGWKYADDIRQFFGSDECFDLLEEMYPMRADVRVWREHIGWRP